jgi:tRNA dimethylallyltransferase
VIRRRIEERYLVQVADGFLDEVRALDRGDAPPGRTATQALGYRELHEHLGGTCTLDEALSAAVARTRRFARRQRMWFRRDPRIRWLAVAEDPTTLADVAALRARTG